MIKKLTIVSLVGIALGATGLISGKAFAYRDDPNVKGPYYTEERHEAMLKAFENKDYDVWKALMQERGRVTQAVNEQNFAKFAEAHKLMLDGKIDESNKIKTELGLGLHNGSGRGYGQGMGRGFSQSN